jgi:hypothetical protein
VRINLYHHEMPHMAERAEHVTKTADTGITFHGLRLYTEPPLEHEPGDDDSAAVTFWVPWTRRGGHDTRDIRSIAHRLLAFCESVDRAEGRQ